MTTQPIDDTERVTAEQLINDAPTPAVAEVIRAAARTAPTGDALLADIVGRHDGRWLDELALDELRDAWRYYHGLTEWPHTPAPVDTLVDQVPVDTFATNPRDPEPGWFAAEAVVPERGTGVTPDWFTIHEHGWHCAHPHSDPSTAIGTSRLPAHQVTRGALAHLDTYHPGWKLPCLRCNRPQWNAEGSRYCYDCRSWQVAE